MGVHSDRSPSGSSRWIACAGSVGLIKKLGLKQQSTIFTEEGNVAHKIGETLLKLPIKEQDNYKKAIVGQTAKYVFGVAEWSEIIITQEMLDYVQIYVNFVLDLKKPSSILYVEEKLPLFYELESYGTADAIVIYRNHLHIIDLKFGKNWLVPIGSQLEIYAINALEMYSWAIDFELITMHIVQPRRDHIVSQTVTVSDLLKRKAYIQHRADLTLAEDPEFTPGDEQCRWCPGRLEGACRALADHSLAAIHLDFNDLTQQKEPKLPDISLLSDEEKRVIIDNADLIEKWLKGVKGSVYNRLLNGYEFDGYKLVEGNSKRVWVDEDSAFMVLSRVFSNEELLKEKLISPAQAEKLIKNKHKDFQEEVLSCIKKPVGNPVLVKETDEREALKTSIFDDFNNLDDEVNINE